MLKDIPNIEIACYPFTYNNSTLSFGALRHQAIPLDYSRVPES